MIINNIITLPPPITPLKTEIWAYFDKYYLISNFGRWYSLKTNKEIKSKINNNGYEYIYLFYNGIKVFNFTHICVVITFGDCKNNKIKVLKSLRNRTSILRRTGLSIDHLNANRQDNRQCNLEIVKHSTNIKRIYKRKRYEKFK